MNYQKLVIVGNVTADPKRQTSKKGDVAYTLFRVAVSEVKESAVYLPIAAFGKLGEIVLKFVTKGQQVLVEGRVTVSETGRFGVVADKVKFGAAPKEAQAESKEK